MYTQMFVVEFDGFDRIKYITSCAIHKNYTWNPPTISHKSFLSKEDNQKKILLCIESDKLKKLSFWEALLIWHLDIDAVKQRLITKGLLSQVFNKSIQ